MHPTQKFRVTPSLVRTVIITALILLYSGWIIFIVSSHKGFDFYAYYLGAYSFSQGINLYEANLNGQTWWDDFATDLNLTAAYAFPYRYPPLTAVMVMPLLRLGPSTAFAVWSVVGCLALLGAAWLTEKALIGNSFLPWLTLLLSLPILTTLYAGQVNTWLLLSFALVFYGLAKKRPALTGFGIAFGALVKVLPILLLGYLFWRKNWGAVVYSLLFLLLLTLVALPFVGLESTLSAPRYVLQSGQGLPSPDVENQSVGAFIHRFFRNHTSPAIVDAPALTPIIYTLFQIFMGGISLFLLWPWGKRRGDIPLEYGYVVLVILALTPLAWYHYLALAVIPIAILADNYVRQKQIGCLFLLGSSTLLVSLHGVIWKQIQAIPIINSGPAIITLLLLALYGREIYNHRTTHDKQHLHV